MNQSNVFHYRKEAYIFSGVTHMQLFMFTQLWNNTKWKIFWGADIYFRSRNTFQGLLKVNCNTCEACKPSLPSLVIQTHFLEKQDMMACWVLDENHSNERIHPQHVSNHFLPNIAQPNPALGPAHPQPSPAARLSGETRKQVWWLSTSGVRNCARLSGSASFPADLV